MTAASLWSCVVLAGILQLASGIEQLNSSFTDPGPLFLTPFIKNGSIEEARNRSRVNLFKEIANATAYSGYITVNETTGSNLFFLHIEAQNNSSTAPLMLWVQGGPGLSSLFGQFLQNGPVGISASGDLFHRNLTTQKDVNIVYLDVPVGAGFSFTRNVSGFARSLQDITVDITEFLRQFEKLFCEYICRDFYVAGESYGARYAVSLARSLKTNQSGNITLKLQGTIGGVGFFGSVFQTADSSNFLYAASMLTVQGRDEFAARFELMRNLTSSHDPGQFYKAVYMLVQTIFNSIPPNPPTLFQNLTLYNSHASPLYSEMPLHMLQYIDYVNNTKFKEAIHVGKDGCFQYYNESLIYNLSLDLAYDVSPQIEFLLNESRVLFYTAQMDTVFPATNLQAYFRSLNWTYASEYRNASRVPWTPYAGCQGMCGYKITVHNYTEAMLLGAGHYAAVDKPDEAYYLMKEFITENKISPMC